MRVNMYVHMMRYDEIIFKNELSAKKKVASIKYVTRI